MDRLPVGQFGMTVDKMEKVFAFRLMFSFLSPVPHPIFFL